ncbi:sigma-70 family RNA polymerase sigma factor [Longispora sp. NPDC051575]|uniref:RNA polymerase sigma factor n=1 Tax=Longispora sp. NPDC051575 TaxID=3154943 RepID=UPI003434B450
MDAAFSSYYRSFAPTLVAFLIWQGARLHDAAELAQETMIEAYRSWESIEHPRSWARRVASRKYGRMIARVEALPAELAEDQVPLLSVRCDVAEWEQRQDVLRRLARLPARQRQVMAWRLDGYEPAEIADELSMTPEAVRSSLLKARRAIQALLSGEEEANYA